MLGYFKAEPTEFARIKAGGTIKTEGIGITAFYIPFRTTIEMVSLATVDQPFVFNEVSADKQDVALQGGLIYRVAKPELLIARYNFSVEPKTKNYLTEDAKKFPQCLVQSIQANARNIIQATQLEKLLVMTDDISSQVLEKVAKDPTIANMGITVDMLYMSSIKPKPEISKALEAEYRERLLQRADEAIFARRALAVEKERAIQENELRTKIELEEKRKALVDLQAENTLKEAEAKAQAQQKEIDVFKGVDPVLLTAQALYQLGRNAEKIENLNITPDILAGILNRKGVRE
jgi:hypothetical protein